MRTMMLLTIITLLTMSIAKSEETNTNIVTEKVTVVKDWFQKEWNETVEFQKAGWEQGKTQTANNIKKIKGFFSNLTTNNQ